MARPSETLRPNSAKRAATDPMTRRLSIDATSNSTRLKPRRRGVVPPVGLGMAKEVLMVCGLSVEPVS
jgi:hypothetical protein